MPGLLRPRLSCFYCGRRSVHAKDGKTRHFTCQFCEATNYLDQNGDITDPPTTPAKPQTKTFAHARNKSLSPVPTASDDNLFCKICLKNQHFLTTCLAEYLPSEDDPDYEKYERQYPQYRKQLELRYPQVCQQCAPRVQERIRKTGYAAKVDFLTRSIERSKLNPISSSSSTKNLAVWFLKVADFAWSASMLIQALWHALNMLAIPADQEQIANMRPLEIIGCTIDAVQHKFLRPGCGHLFVEVVRLSLQFSLLLAWWNPAIKTKLRSPGFNYQWTGLGEFYQYQAITLFIRFVAWSKLSDLSALAYPTDFHRVFHGVVFFYILIALVASHRMVDYVRVQRISFKDTNEPLVDPNSFQYPTDTHVHPLSNHPVSALRQSPAQPFNISNLAPRRHLDHANHSSPAGPPTPPESDTDLASQLDAGDSMDWEPLPRQSSPLLKRTHNPTVPTMTSSFPPMQPSTNPAIPAFLRPPATASSGQKSPFTGRLPPAPISPAHRILNPPVQPIFKPTPLSKQQDFFKQMGLSTAALDSKHQGQPPKHQRRPSSADSNDTVPSPSNTYVRTDKAEKDPFRPAQWTLKSDLDAAVKGTGTGLEDMFSSSFKLGDDTPRRPTRYVNVDVGRGGRGDGREIFDSATARTAQAAKIVGSNLQLLYLPALLAVLALAVHLFRDPSGREHVGELVAECMRFVRPAVGGVAGVGGYVPTSTLEE